MIKKLQILWLSDLEMSLAPQGVIPIFQDQIKKGGPLTVTDPNMERFFMSIPEASQLILQAGSFWNWRRNIYFGYGKSNKNHRYCKSINKTIWL